MNDFSHWTIPLADESEITFTVELPESTVHEIDAACERLHMDRPLFVKYAIWYALGSMSDETTDWLE